MRKIAFWALALLMMACQTAFADNYDALWKQYEAAITKDLPKTAINVLNKIEQRAKADKQYGSMLKALICRGGLQTSIAPDSLLSEVQRLEAAELSLREKQPVVAAVLQSALAELYRNNYELNDRKGEKAQAYLKMSLQHPELLVTASAKGYEPLLEPGIDSRIFNNDLLHVLAMRAGEYRLMYNHYVTAGNRRAACIVASMMFRRGESNFTESDSISDEDSRPLYFYKSRFVHRLDSIINLYADLPEAGELAIIRYQKMRYAEDVDTKDALAYINTALDKWGSWKRMNNLRNAYKEAINPIFSVEHRELVLPDKQQWVYLKSVRNLGKITMKVSRLNVNGLFNKSIDNKDVIAQLRKTMKPVPSATRECKFVGVPPYVYSNDSLELQGLPPGAYLLEFISDNKDVPVKYARMDVTNVTAVVQAMPNRVVRIAVLNATTGHPIPHAKVRLNIRSRYSYKYRTEQHQCGENGELEYSQGEDDALEAIYPYTSTDVYAPERGCNTYYSGSSEHKDKVRLHLFTDRSIYRPGQTINVAGICVRHGSDLERTAVGGEKFIMELFDSNYKRVARCTAVSDAFGKFSAQFTLPSNGLTGSFGVSARGIANSNVDVRVEEYKRPTFEVIFPKVNEKYAPGDTVVVTGHAKSFAGVPVQGAKVQYKVRRAPAFWWWWRSSNDERGTEIAGETTITDDDGAFKVSIPLTLPDSKQRYGFYSFDVVATVVDQGGETRVGSMSLPVGSRPTALSCNVPNQVEKDSLKTITFSFRNASGVEIPGHVRYYIDNESDVQHVKANTPIAFDAASLVSGKHRLVAICEKDTVEHDFVLFSMKDRRPVVESDMWVYQTATKFNLANKPVYTQVGTSLKDAYVLYAIYSNDRIIEKGTTIISDSLLTIPFTYKPEYGDGITISYVWTKDDHCYDTYLSIKRAMPDKRLMAEWKTFRNKLTPGQKEEWTLSLKYPNGKPANAQLMATLYDKSLDQILNHRWDFGLGYYFSTPSTYWQWIWNKRKVYLYGENPLRPLIVPDLKYYHFASECFEWSYGFTRFSAIALMDAKGNDMAVEKRSVGATRKAYAAALDVNVRGTRAVAEEASDERNDGEVMKVKDADNSSNNGGNAKADKPAIRENMNETAFFYPALTTDANGNVAIKFTLPESITTWRFMGLATDKALNNVLVENEAVASKKMMVQPNMPRFMRLGDKGWITARVINTTNKAITGKALIEIVDAETDRVFYSETKTCTVNGGQTGNVSFLLNLQEGSKFYDAGAKVWICRISVSGQGFSDGEQHYLPLLSDTELVTNSKAFTMHRPGKLSIDLRKLFAVNKPSNRLTIEFTNNPAWMMVQTLPYMGNTYEDDAVSLATSFYVNSLAKYLMDQAPVIKRTVELWSQEKNGQGSMVSELEKNQELKTLVLNETPWVLDAENETQQRQQLVRFFDENGIAQRLNTATNKLRKLQRNDGGWCWCPYMQSSPWMTLSVCEMITRLQTLTGGRTDMNRNLERAFDFMGSIVRDEVAEIKKLERKGEKNVRPSEWAVKYLYVSSLVDDAYYEDVKAERKFLITRLAKQPAAFTIYGKAVSAVILAKNGYPQMGKEYLQSIREYSVFTEEMGRYYDTRKAYYSWFDYKIPTQVAAIEAIQALEPSDTTTLDEMKRWLLQQKRTQIWDTPINSVNAVYAFLNGNMEVLQAASDSPAKLSVDGVRLETPNASAGLGYVKTAMPGANVSTFSVDKTAKGTSWGSVYAQFMQRTTDVADASMGLTIKRELIYDGELRVGSKVKVRITITADRDYDFVQVVEKRAACMEPIKQLTGYNGRFYCSPRDNATYYYTDMMRKGTHVIENTYYIDRPGTFTTGTCTVQCAYSPAYMARTKALTITIK